MDFEFEKNSEVPSLEKVPEHFRSLYKQEGDKFILNPEMKSVAGAVDGLNKANRNVRKEMDKLRQSVPDVGPFKKLGQLLNIAEEEATPEALQAAIDEVVKKAAGGDQTYKVNLDKMKKDLEKARDQALAAKDQELQGMSGTLNKYLVENAAVQAIAKLKGSPELLLPTIKANVKVVKEGNEHVVRVLDAQGDPRGDGKGGFMTVEDYVKELKASPTYGRAFDSEAPNGGGKPPNRGSAGVQKPQGEMNATQRIAAGLRNRAR